jgi:putative endonuclease
MPLAAPWYAYLLRCADGTLYAGVTTDVERRVEEHNGSGLGAKYTRARRPVELAYQEGFATRSEACAREAALKRLSRAHKLELIASAAASG